jgi:hypothetical protein
MRDVIGGRFRDNWLSITSMVLCAVALFAVFLRWVRRLAFAATVYPQRQASAPGSDVKSAIEQAKEQLPMTENPNPDNKVLHINHGPSHHLNTPGGMMNFGPVTVTQNFGTQQTPEEPVQQKSGEGIAGTIGGDETIDINSLVELSAKVKSPGICSNTVRKILKDAGITPCAIEKDGKATRNLYPRKESQGVVSAYMTDKRL